MSKWAEFQTQAEAVQFCEKMDLMYGYPDVEHGTERYTYIQKHPSKKAFICAVEEGHLFMLDAEDETKLKDADAVKVYFPEEKGS